MHNPDLHFPEGAATAAEAAFVSDVVFVGTADADRLPYLDALSIPDCASRAWLGLGTPAGVHRCLARGTAIGRSYRLALSGAKIALGLLRSANRDRHTMRTFEIPACGAFLCTLRTDEHQEIFRDGIEAVFFDDPDHLKTLVARYLSDDDARARIGADGFRAVTQRNHTYADRIVEMATLARRSIAGRLAHAPATRKSPMTYGLSDVRSEVIARYISTSPGIHRPSDSAERQAFVGRTSTREWLPQDRDLDGSISRAARVN